MHNVHTHMCERVSGFAKQWLCELWTLQERTDSTPLWKVTHSWYTINSIYFSSLIKKRLVKGQLPKAWVSNRSSTVYWSGSMKYWSGPLPPAEGLILLKPHTAKESSRKIDGRKREGSCVRNNRNVGKNIRRVRKHFALSPLTWQWWSCREVESIRWK